MTKKRIGDLLAVAMLLFAVTSVTGAAYAQTYSVLYNFGSNSNDPANPSYEGIIAQGRDGNLYSTTPNGGANRLGAVFKITPAGTLTLVYSFDSAHGPPPASGLTLGTDGNFYGTTEGGTSGHGTIFKVTPSGRLSVLYDFTGGSDGGGPVTPPIQGTDDNFYGTTYSGGTNGLGTVYKITAQGKLKTLYSFDGIHGGAPIAPLVQGTDGNFYGTTQGGGTAGYGVVYKIKASGNLTVIYNFDRTHGSEPGPLVQASDGNFYGTTDFGGRKGSGVVFKVTPTGKLTVLHNINGTTEGRNPIAGLVQATDDKFYGVNYTAGSKSEGTLFRISPKKPYAYQVLYTFDLTTGANPEVALLQNTNGILYGNTQVGGTGNVNPCSVSTCGVVYSLNIGAGPFVSLVSTAGKVGKKIGILGQGLTGTTGVSFNGIPATFFKVLSDTYLTAAVPTGATSGFVTVTTPKGNLKSNKKFRVL